MFRNMIAAALVVGLGFGAGAQQMRDRTVPEIEEYIIGTGDVLEIFVLEDSSLNRQVLVRPDGKITLPLAGTVDAAGVSPETLQDRIRARLSEDFLEPPTVTVSLVTAAAEAEEEELLLFYVVGEVASPGRFETEEPVDVLQALAVAGGPSVFAATERIQIRTRDENGGEVVRLFNYESVLEGSGTELFVIEDGTVVVVPERGLFE